MVGEPRGKILPFPTQAPVPPELPETWRDRVRGRVSELLRERPLYGTDDPAMLVFVLFGFVGCIGIALAVTEIANRL